jgi:hypothetical protein
MSELEGTIAFSDLARRRGNSPDDQTANTESYVRRTLVEVDAAIERADRLRAEVDAAESKAGDA